MSYFLPPKPPLVYLERTLLHQPVVDFPFEHLNIFKEKIFKTKWYGGVTWYRYLVDNLDTSACRAASHVAAIPQGALGFVATP